MAESKQKFAKKDLTTGIGILSFPHIFPSTATTKDNGEKGYDIQIIISKQDKASIRAILGAIKEVGESRFGENYRKVRLPLRDGDKEAGDITDDGTTKGEKYPERLGCYFLNARSTKAPFVGDRQRNVITEPDAVYGGCKGKIAVTFYTYSNNGNTGVGCGLNGVQKVSDGDAFGGGRPAVESMFEMLEDDDYGLDDEGEDTAPEPEAKPAARKRTAPKSGAAKKKAEPEPEPDDDLDDLDSLPDADDDGDLGDAFDDL